MFLSSCKQIAVFGVLCFFVLVACGGGSSGSGESAVVVPSPAPSPTATVASSPSPSPTPTRVPDVITVNPSTLAFSAIGDSLAVQVGEFGFTGKFVETSTNCPGIVSISLDTNVANQFDINATGIGLCKVVFADGGSGIPATLSVSVTQASIAIGSKRRK